MRVGAFSHAPAVIRASLQSALIRQIGSWSMVLQQNMASLSRYFQMCRHANQFQIWLNLSPYHCRELRRIWGQRRNSVAELSEDDRQTVHEEWQI